MHSFVDMLFNKHILPPPPVGAGRIHLIDDAADEIPDQPTRFQEILWAVDNGGSSYDTIVSQMTCRVPKPMLVADCEELAVRGLLVIKRSGSATRYFPRNQDADAVRESAQTQSGS